MRPALITILLATLAASQASCRKRPAGTCAEDIDCPAGYDCRTGTCAKRAAVPGLAPGAPESNNAPPPPAVEPAAPATTDAATVPDASAQPAPPKRKLAPPAPPIPPPVPLPQPPPGRLPMWKERLKNT